MNTIIERSGMTQVCVNEILQQLYEINELTFLIHLKFCLNTLWDRNIEIQFWTEYLFIISSFLKIRHSAISDKKVFYVNQEKYLKQRCQTLFSWDIFGFQYRCLSFVAAILSLFKSKSMIP